MKIKSLKEQNKILKKHFGITVDFPETLPVMDKRAEGYFLIPKWEKIAPTYNEALQKVLDAIKSTRPFYNWVEGKIGPEYLRESKDKGTTPEVLACQLGKLHKGESVASVRINKPKDEILLGAYEVGIIILTHPEVLEKWEDLWLDCPGDEYDYPDSGVRFDGAPYFYFYDSRVEFVTKGVSVASGFYGSVSGLLPNNRTDDTLNSCPTKINRQESTTSIQELKQGVKIKITIVTTITEVEE